MTIKVCGMREAENIRAAESLGVDMMGFIFYEKSPRFAGYSVPSYMPSCKRVGVFVDASSEEIAARAKAFGLDHVQLHGHESPAFCQEVRSMLPGVKIIKAFGIGEKSDFARTEAYSSAVDMFLFDTACKSHGGSGESFDWSLLEAYEGSLPFLLSGGIGPESDISGIRHPKCAGIDLNSKFELAPAVKDIESLKKFINHIRYE